MTTEIQMLLQRIQQVEEKAERAKQERDELLSALEGLIANYYYNQRKGLGFGPLVRATNAVAWAKKFKGKDE